MLNKTNILVIFILFTLGCINLPETTDSNTTGQGITEADINATVMAMFEASNSNETVKKDPSADTQVNITSANAEQAVSVNLEATIEALRKELLTPNSPGIGNTSIDRSEAIVSNVIPTPTQESKGLSLFSKLFSSPTSTPTKLAQLAHHSVQIAESNWPPIAGSKFP